MRCPHYRNKFPIGDEKPIPYKFEWRGKGEAIPRQIVDCYCDGEWHTWKDSGGTEWSSRCPNANQAAKIEIIERYIVGKCPTFEDFIVGYNNQSAEVRQIQEFPKSQLKKLIIRGDKWTGKTHLAKALFYRLCMNGEACVFYHSEKLSELFRRNEKDDSDAISDMQDLWQSSWLFIDDLGTERLTDTGLFERKLKYILDSYRGRIVITSNLEFPSMTNMGKPGVFPYDERVIQRLKSGSRIINFAGYPYREPMR